MEHILLVEDNLPDIELIKRFLEDAPFPYRFYTAKSLQDGLDIIRHNPINVVLLDLGLDDTTGLPTLNHFFDEVPDLPVVVLTGNTNEIIGLNAIRSGAQDLLIKGDFNGKQLIRAIRHAMLRFKKQTDLQTETWEMRQQKKHNQQLLAWVKLGSWQLDLLDNSMIWSDEMFQILGFQPDSFIPKFADYLRVVYNEDRERVEAFFDNVSKTGASSEIEHRAIINNRTVKYLYLRAKVVIEEPGGKILISGSLQDITELRKIGEKNDQRIEHSLSALYSLHNIARAMGNPLTELLGFINLASNESSENQQTLLRDAKLRIAQLADLIFHQINTIFFVCSDWLVKEEMMSLANWKGILQSILQVLSLKQGAAWTLQWEEPDTERISANRFLLTALIYNLLCVLLDFGIGKNQLEIRVSQKTDRDEQQWLHFLISTSGQASGHARWKELEGKLSAILKKKNAQRVEEKSELSIWTVAKLLSVMKGQIGVNKKHDIEVKFPVQLHAAPKENSKHPLRALIVEHQSIIQIALRRILQSNFRQIELSYADNLNDGDEQVRANEFDLVFVNAQIPIHNGIGIHHLFQNAKSVPVIALASDPSPERKNELMQAGAADCIANPPVREELLQAIQKVIAN